ncbi:MAG TPA: hypothetical protein VMW50_13980 [Dehalococcoidia bacterium]|nr:hypothetical protein [Dehalococcoidia bacterium]
MRKYFIATCIFIIVCFTIGISSYFAGKSAGIKSITNFIGNGHADIEIIELRQERNFKTFLQHIGQLENSRRTGAIELGKLQAINGRIIRELDDANARLQAYSDAVTTAINNRQENYRVLEAIGNEFKRRWETGN